MDEAQVGPCRLGLGQQAAQRWLIHFAGCKKRLPALSLLQSGARQWWIAALRISSNRAWVLVTWSEVQWNLVLEFQQMRWAWHAVEFSGKGQAPTPTTPKFLDVVVGQRFDGSVLHPGIGRLSSVVVLRQGRKRQTYGESQQKNVCNHVVSSDGS